VGRLLQAPPIVKRVLVEFEHVETPGDLQQLVKFLCNDGWPFHGQRRLTPDDVIAMDFTSAEAVSYWIIEQGHVVGLIRVLDLSDIGRGAPLLDIRIAGEHRGRRLGTRATHWVVGHLFDSYPDLHRIEAATRHDNTAMQRVLSNTGFVNEGRLRDAWWSDSGQWFDTMIFGMLRRDWNKRLEIDS